MERKGIKAKPLSLAAGLGPTAVRDLLDPDSGDVRLGTLFKLAVPLQSSIEDLIGSDLVPLTGRVGAGGTIIFDELDQNDLVPRPPSITGPLEALEVVGDSMFPKYTSGDVIYIQRNHDGVLPIYVGEFCAIRLISGESYLKLLAKGSRPGVFTLRSLNAPDIEDVEVEWATPVLFVLPRFARRTMLI